MSETHRVPNFQSDIHYSNLVPVEGGSFIIGEDYITIPHNVDLPSFYIGKNAVTFAEYDAFCIATEHMQAFDCYWGRDKRPVILVEWLECLSYCNWLSQQHGLIPSYDIQNSIVQWDISANGYRLPTEAEWEYAARGGIQTHGFQYSGSNDIMKVAWCSVAQTYDVCKKEANELGLYDMNGNVWEWCWNKWVGKDRFDRNERDNGDNNIDILRNDVFITKGGAWRNNHSRMHVAMRMGSSGAGNDIGFRLARNADY